MRFFTNLLLFSMIAHSVAAQVIPDQSTLKARAPEKFFVLFQTSKGDITAEVIRQWSPLAADRFYQLVMTGFYNQNRFFRVQKDYVVQFGISDSKVVNEFWDKLNLYDEPVMTGNQRGTISYARDGICSRTAQLFINLKDNPKLDTVNYNGLRGFPPFARIVSGFETVEKLYSGYGFEPANHQDSIMVYGNSYLKKYYPDLDFIIEVKEIASPGN